MAIHFTNPGRIKVFLKDPNKKNIFKMLKEVIVLWITKKEVPMYYFKHLYKKDVKNYKDYLGPTLGHRIHNSKVLHKEEYTSILNNKLNFSLYCEKNEIPTPKLIGHNFGSSFFTENGIREIVNIKELIQFYDGIFESMDAIFFRPLNLYGGQGCFKLDRQRYPQQLQAVHKNLLNGNYVHTKVIAQHPKINVIYAKSINTLRILTHMDKGHIDIIFSFMRFGTGGNTVDNAHAGGLCVPIVQETGKLNQWSYKGLEYGGGEFEKHPDTGFAFYNFQIPFFKEACELAKDASRHIPNGFVGWDIAITPNGPMVIEGNQNPALFVSDVLYGGLWKNLEMQKMIARL